MTQQTTMDRIFDLILSATQAWTQDEAAEQIAAEIDALTRERDIAKRDADILQRVNGEIKRERDEARVTVRRVKEDHNDTLRRLESAQAQLFEARAMIDTLKPSWMGDNPRPETLVETCQRLAAEVNTLTAQLAEARSTIDLVRRSASDYEVQAGQVREELAVESELAQATISRLTFQYETANRESALHAKQRDEARAEVERRESDLSAARITITELESGRNGANAFLDEVAFILKMPPAYMGGVNGWAEVKMSELSEARAEVERLRPAAAAYNAYLAWRLAPLNSEEEASAANAWIEADKLVRAARRAA